MLWALTLRELKSRYAGSVVGMFWAYLQPALTVAAYYLVFDVVFSMRLGDSAPTKSVGIYLIVGALPWMAFGDALSRGTSSILDSAGLLQKNAIPIAFMPARAVLSSALVFTPLMMMLTVAYWPLHKSIWPVFAVAQLWVLQVVLVLSFSVLLSVLAVAVKDTAQMVTFSLQIGIFISPALFPYAQFPDAWRWVLWINPMTPLLLGYQSVLLKGAWPSVDVWLALCVWILIFSTSAKIVYFRSKEYLVDWL